MGSVNTSSRRGGFARLEGSVPQGQYDNGLVMLGKDMNPRPFVGSIRGAVLLCELRKDVDVSSAQWDLRG